MRYIALIILNLPIVFFALLNIITQYKMHKISKRRFIRQVILWAGILIVLIASFPAYNLITQKPLLDSTDLSIFDIVQTTAIVFLFYAANNQRRKIELAERRLRDLHQELSIKMSEKK